MFNHSHVLLTFVLIIISTVSGLSQTPTKTSLGTFSFSSYPTAPIPLGYKLYAVVDDKGMSYPPASPAAQNIKFKSLKKVRIAESADIIIRITNIEVKLYPPLIIDKKDIKKEGEIMYKAKQKKEISFDVLISDSSSIIHQDQVWKVENAESQWMSTPERAEKSVYYRLQNFNLDNEFQKYNELICNKLGTNKLNDIKIHLYGAKAKKNSTEDYQELNQAVTTFQKATDIIRVDEYAIDKFKEKVQSCVEVWEKELEQCNDAESDRLTEEMVASLHYNLASYYILTKEYENALNELDTCEKIYKGFGDANQINTLVRSWRNLQYTYEKMMK